MPLQLTRSRRALTQLQKLLLRYAKQFLPLIAQLKANKVVHTYIKVEAPSR